MAIQQQFRSGWPTFAGVVAAVAGIYNVLSGLAAVTSDDRTEALGDVLYGIDVSAWGWFWLILGVVQLVIAVLIFMRHPMGQILGVAWAVLSASLTVFIIFVAPLWALSVLAIDMLVIYALLVHPEEWDRA
jgi:hypothetical protein